MKNLLTAIKTALQNASALSYVADASIFIMEDDDLLPAVPVFPAIGIKDGAITNNFAYTSGAKVGFEQTAQVRINIFVAHAGTDVSIMGQTSPAVKGTLDIRNDVNATLLNNTLSISKVLEALPIDESESELLAGEDLATVRKRITYRYKRMIEK